MVAFRGLGFRFGDMAEVEDYEIIREGEAEILQLKKNAVFFNPVQVPPSSIFCVDCLDFLSAVAWGLTSCGLGIQSVPLN